MNIFLPFLRNKIYTSALLFAASLISLFSTLIIVAPAYAIDTQTMSAYPTYSYDADPRSKSWFIYSLPAGEKKEDSVTVVNHGSEPLTLKVYAVDSTTSSNGGFALAAESAPKNDIGAWVKLGLDTITLAPNEQENIPFSITIPDNATGDHSGGIVFQTTKPQVIDSKGMGINVISRVGVRIYETVPSPDQLNVDVRDLHYSVDGNYLTFIFTVEDKGTVHIQPTGMLQVKDMFGRVITSKPLDTLIGVLIPGKPQTITVPTQVLSPMIGWDTASVWVYYSPTKAAMTNLTFMPNPWGMFILILVILLAVAYFVAKPRLVHYKGKNHTAVPAPHVLLIVTCILLCAVAASGLISFLLSQMF